MTNLLITLLAAKTSSLQLMTCANNSQSLESNKNTVLNNMVVKKVEI